MLKTEFPELKIDYDMDETNLPYPCGHTVIRIKGIYFSIEKIVSLISKKGFVCEIMKDKIYA
ncbi:hypothetical protein [uncultured Kordia sp.]|uniref:hypothetical protein n=1 Tax=uncultured Kordia sp. TaxID=507699 RepID=UPI002619394E|nr:hypothetical protein [uncultured Kordia sp.]